MTPTKETRAEWAATALDVYGINKEGRADYDAPEEMAGDLICDLMYLIRAHDADPLQKLAVAQMNFEAEEAEELPKNKLTKTADYTTKDADRLLGLADEFLSNWADQAVNSGNRDPDYEERNAEWDVYRPLFENAPALFAGMKRAITALNTVPNFKTPEGITSYKLLSELDKIVAQVPKVD